MKFETIQQQYKFKGKYEYKFFMNFNVLWNQQDQSETWKSYIHKKQATEINEYLDTLSKTFLRQGNIYFIDNLNTAFKFRLMYDEFIVKIEKWEEV